MASDGGHRFKLVEERSSYTERELFAAPTLEEIQEFLDGKGGRRD